MRKIGALCALILFLAGALTVSSETRRKTAGSQAKSKGSQAKRRPVAKGKSRTSAPRSTRQLSPSTERYMEIQQALASKGFYAGPVNGKWGPESVAALKRFQEAQNLRPDGRLGALSLISLGLGPKHDTIAVQ